MTMSLYEIELFAKYLKRKGSNPRVKKVEIIQCTDSEKYGILVTYKKRSKKVELIKKALRKIELAILLAENCLENERLNPT